MIEMGLAVAPVRQRPIDVDADGVDRARGPEGIEMKIDVARAVLRLMPAMLRPIGAVGDLRAGPEHASHVFGQIDERGDEGKC